MLTVFAELYRATSDIEFLEKLTYHSNLLQNERQYINLVRDRDDIQRFICDGFMIEKWERMLPNQHLSIDIRGSFLSLDGQIIHFTMAHHPDQDQNYESFFDIPVSSENWFCDGGSLREWYGPIRKELGIPKTYVEHGKLMWTLRAILGIFTVSGKREDYFSEVDERGWDSDQWSSDEE